MLRVNTFVSVKSQPQYINGHIYAKARVLRLYEGSEHPGATTEVEIETEWVPGGCRRIIFPVKEFFRVFEVWK